MMPPGSRALLADGLLAPAVVFSTPLDARPLYERTCRELFRCPLWGDRHPITLSLPELCVWTGIVSVNALAPLRRKRAKDRRDRRLQARPADAVACRLRQAGRAVRYHRRRSAPASASPSRGPGNGILWDPLTRRSRTRLASFA